MTALARDAVSPTTRPRLLRLLRRSSRRVPLRRRVDGVTLAELEDSRRPLLFSLLPRMLRGDGSTAPFLQTTVPVSSRRWMRALATSRRLAFRRQR